MDNSVLISGAGSGIGQAIAISLSERGYRLILLGRNPTALEETLARLPNGRGHLIVRADVRDATAVRAALASGAIGPLHAVIANAGIGGENHYGDRDRWNEIIATNLTGTYTLGMECLPHLLQCESAKAFRHVVIVSSILARLGVPGYSAYCAAKAGLLGLMRSWAVEWAPRRILVNAVLPGWVRTSMTIAGLQEFAAQSGRSLELEYEHQMQHVLLKKMCEPGEIAELISYLISEHQCSMTGQSLDINNGALMA